MERLEREGEEVEKDRENSSCFPFPFPSSSWLSSWSSQPSEKQRESSKEDDPGDVSEEKSLLEEEFEIPSERLDLLILGGFLDFHLGSLQTSSTT